MPRSIDIDIDIEEGAAGLVHARGRQMGNLMLLGRSEDELWRDVGTVLWDLLDVQGEKVAAMTIDRVGRRVHVQTA